MLRKRSLTNHPGYDTSDTVNDSRFAGNDPLNRRSAASPAEAAATEAEAPDRPVTEAVMEAEPAATESVTAERLPSPNKLPTRPRRPRTPSTQPPLKLPSRPRAHWRPKPLRQPDRKSVA